jgi:hypothetical protein
VVTAVLEVASGDIVFELVDFVSSILRGHFVKFGNK